MRGRSFTCWKVRATPARAIRNWRCALISRAIEDDRAAVRPSAPVSRLNIVDLPAPFGPIRPRISPASSSKLSSLTATRPPKRRSAARTSAAARPAPAASGAEAAGPARAPGAFGLGRRRRDERREALARVLQEQDEQRGEHDDLQLAGGALGDQRQLILNRVLQQRDHARAEDAADRAGRAADHRHHQIFDAHLGAERGRADVAAEMGVEPARERRQRRPR